VIVGIGVDVCEVSRLESALGRTHGMTERLFTEGERSLPAASLAARFAAKEALAKALGAPPGLSWLDAEVVNEPTGKPRLAINGSVREAADVLGVSKVHVSLSHDAGIATAFVLLESG
jgi:holo-[acyl-carrier protein] synthase